MSKKHVIIFEARGGSDKGPDGHRKDTMPIVNAINAKPGWSAETLFFEDDKKDEIFDYVSKNAVAYVSRINPGNLPNGESIYFDTLRRLSDAGVIGMPHPDAMSNFGAKDALTKLNKTGLVPEDTYSYYTIEDFKEKFPFTVALGERVLKQNRGSTGSGIWRVEVIDKESIKPGEKAPLNTKIKCTEAVDNHVEINELGDFMTFCEQYIVGENGMLIDMKFLPRIKEGEVRILMVGPNPIFVVHKKPAAGADAFSATLFSGAVYTYDPPEKWQTLIDFFQSQLPVISKNLGGFEPPLIWTADFILDWDKDGNDTYVLGEFNASCVGFTSHLEHGIQEKIADEIERVVEG